MSNMSNGQQTSFPSVQDEGLFAGFLPDYASQERDILSYVNEETTAGIPFGVMVAQGTADRGCVLMAAQNDDLIGIVVKNQAYDTKRELDDNGALKPDVMVNVLRRGRIWVAVDESVAPGDDVRVDEDGGTFTKTAENDVTIDISKNARWLSSTTGAGLALLEFDMTGLTANATADAE